MDICRHNNLIPIISQTVDEQTTTLKQNLSNFHACLYVHTLLAFLSPSIQICCLALLCANILRQDYSIRQESGNLNSIQFHFVGIRLVFVSFLPCCPHHPSFYMNFITRYKPLTSFCAHAKRFCSANDKAPIPVPRSTDTLVGIGTWMENSRIYTTIQRKYNNRKKKLISSQLLALLWPHIFYNLLSLGIPGVHLQQRIALFRLCTIVAWTIFIAHSVCGRLLFCYCFVPMAGLRPQIAIPIYIYIIWVNLAFVLSFHFMIAIKRHVSVVTGNALLWPFFSASNAVCCLHIICKLHPPTHWWQCGLGG